MMPARCMGKAPQFNAAREFDLIPTDQFAAGALPADWIPATAGLSCDRPRLNSPSGNWLLRKISRQAQITFSSAAVSLGRCVWGD